MVTMCFKAKVYKNAHFLAPNPCLEILIVKLVKEECCSAPPELHQSCYTVRMRGEMRWGLEGHTCQQENNNPSVAACCSLIVSSAATNPVEHRVCHSEQPKKQAQVSATRSRCAAPAAAPAHRRRLGDVHRRLPRQRLYLT